ncbi:MAG: anthranilate phosphoribosyltransferase [Azospirillaceae bacterium]
MSNLDRLQPFIARIAEGERLNAADSAAAFDIIMSGEATPSQIGAFLMGLRLRGETIDEITGAARIMREKVAGISAPEGAVDCCGTGGDKSGSYNISTAVSFVLAGGGVPVAKHGNRAQSSKTGAADVLAALGVKIDADFRLLERALREAGVCFLFAQRHHGAMRHVGPTRVELGTRTIFNLLGPLSNPAGARRQLMGVFAPEWVVPQAEVLARLGAEAAWVVHGSDGMDEITTTGPTMVAALEGGEVVTFEIAPEDVGIARARPVDLKGSDAETNAAALRGVLAGEAGAYRDIVLMNAGAAFVVAGKAGDLAEGVEQARRSIDAGRAMAALDRLVVISQSPPPEEDE